MPTTSVISSCPSLSEFHVSDPYEFSNLILLGTVWIEHFPTVKSLALNLLTHLDENVLTSYTILYQSSPTGNSPRGGKKEKEEEGNRVAHPRAQWREDRTE